LKSDVTHGIFQEVDHFNFLKTVLGTQGYNGMFFPKPDSPCLYIKGNNGPDGCAIFFREDKFELLKTVTRVLEVWRVQSNQVSPLRLCVVMKCFSQHRLRLCVHTLHITLQDIGLWAKHV